MDLDQKDAHRRVENYKINAQIITFFVIIAVVSATLFSFIRIYSEKKTVVLKDMEIEANLLSTLILDHLNYSQYFVKLIGNNIEKKTEDLEYINQVLYNRSQSQEFNLLFGWQKFSWIDKNFYELATSNSGISETPKKNGFLAAMIEKFKTDPASLPSKDKIIFSLGKNRSKNRSLKLIDIIFDVNHNYNGAIILSYDIDTMVKSLNARKKNANVNFIIINKEFEVVAKSKSEIDKLISEKDVFSYVLSQALARFRTKAENVQEFSYLDMINGVNYFIKPLENFPFAVIVNIENSSLKSEVLSDIAQKTKEASFIACICLVLVIVIYKRETFLRMKAEAATVTALKATDAKTNFLAFTAHEIRSPLGFILTGAEIMHKELFGKLPTSYVKYAEGIFRNANSILEFITDILDENQIIEGKFKIVNTVNKVDEIVDQALKLQSGKKTVKLFLQLEPNLPLLICDRRRMIQVLDNLISNSIKYSPENTEVGISAKIETNGELVMAVTDQGIGMKDEDIPLALSKYKTLDKQEYQKGSSYGLGLPIVKMLLEAHGATFKIESKEGEGTVVKIIFPKHKIVYNTPRSDEHAKEDEHSKPVKFSDDQNNGVPT